MDFKQFLGVVRRRWMSVVAMVLVAVGVASLLSFVVLTPKYQSTSTVFLSVDVRDTTDAFTALYFVQTRATSYADLAQSEELAQRVIDVL